MKQGCELGLRTFGCSIFVTLCILGCQRSRYRPESDQPISTSSPTAKGYYHRPDEKTVAGQASPLKKKIAVFDFWNDTPAKQSNFGAFVASDLKQTLANTRKMIIWPPLAPTDEEVKSTGSTEEFIQGEHVRVAQLLREGRKLGVSLIAIGRIKRITFRQTGDDIGLFRQKYSDVSVELEAKFFDVQAGHEVASVTAQGENSSTHLAAIESLTSNELSILRVDLTQVALHNAVVELVPDVLHALEKISWQGHIAKLIGPKVYISAGRESGLNQGDILKVTNQGQEIYDPLSRALLGRSRGMFKGTLEVTDFLGQDGAVAEIHTGGNFREGDLVELY